MTEKRQTSQGYIIRILQDFATKLDRNFSYKGKGPLSGIMKDRGIIMYPGHIAA
jgi:hypothetical protein